MQTIYRARDVSIAVIPQTMVVAGVLSIHQPRRAAVVEYRMSFCTYAAS